MSSAVGVLSQFISNPDQEHWVGIKRSFRYIKGTLDYGQKFEASGDEEFKLCDYADDDWAGDVTSRKFTTGYVFQLGNTTISWKSKGQTVVALSSTEVEYVALCAAAQEIIWLRHLLVSIRFEKKDATVAHDDNQGTIALTKNPKNHTRTKHIDIKYHFVRKEAVEKKNVRLVYSSTKKIAADILTKALPKPKFDELRRTIGVQQLR